LFESVKRKDHEESVSGVLGGRISELSKPPDVWTALDHVLHEPNPVLHRRNANLESAQFNPGKML